MYFSLRLFLGLSLILFHIFLEFLYIFKEFSQKTYTISQKQTQISPLQQMNISIISESSVDYIARFEDIAAELRAQQQAQEQQQQQDTVAEIEVHRS